MFAVPFDEIAPIVDRSPAAARQLASRARRRVQGEAPAPERDLARQREVVDAFLAASRDGDFDGAGRGARPRRRAARRRRGVAAKLTMVLRGAETVAAQARAGKTFAPYVRRVLVNGSPGALVVMKGRVVTLMSFTVADGRVAEMDIIVEPDRLATLDLADVLS